MRAIVGRERLRGRSARGGDRKQSGDVSVGRNDPCPCGSGKKFKHCCLAKDAIGGPLTGIGDVNPPMAGTPQRLAALARDAQERWAAGLYVEAIGPLLEIAHHRPKSPEAQYELGLTFAKCGRFSEAVARLRAALELRPGFLPALAQLASALEQTQEPAEAAPVHRKLARIVPDTLPRLHHLAKAQMLEGKADEAETTLRRFLALAPDHGAERIVLGELLSDQRRFGDAGEEFKRALETAPRAFQLLAATRRMTEADRPLLERMRPLAQQLALEVETRAAIRFGLGKAYDDLGEYEEAMRQYDAGNALKAASSARFDRAALAHRYDDTIACATAETQERAARALARSRRPGDDLPVLIVGMPRSGTTLTEQILSSHPEVAAAGEQAFWTSRRQDLRLSATGAPDGKALAKASDDYLERLRGYGPNARRVTDKMPKNFEMLAQVRLAFPEARIIHCRRNPIDTCLSNYFSYFVGGVGFAFDRGDIVFQYREYERLMAHWRRVLPPERFLELDYENLIADREAEVRRIVAFIGLEWDDACLAHERNARVVRTASLWQARQPIYTTSVERWRRYEPWLGEFRDLLPEAERVRVGEPFAGEARTVAIESRAAT
jgi:tetratricopeptide (TPR) repeat protein